MESETNNVMQKWVVGTIIILVLIVVGFGLWRWISPSIYPEEKNDKEPIESALINEVYFGCNNSKSIYAKFYKNKVELDLSDGRKVNLPQTISASGARYANIDESFVFWNKGDTAFIQEKSSSGLINTYDNCIGGKG